MKTAELRDGTEASVPLVAVITLILLQLLESEPITFYELVMKSRDPSHKVWPGTTFPPGIMCGDQVAGGVADIVRNAVTGDNADMQLRAPTSEGAPIEETS